MLLPHVSHRLIVVFVANGMAEIVTLRRKKTGLKKIALNSNSHLNYEAVLDGFLLLYNEVKSTQGKASDYSKYFLDKYEKPIKAIRNLQIREDDFKILKLIGYGHFGSVYLVREKANCDLYAMKVMNKSQFSSFQSYSLFEEERKILMSSQSSWLTQLHYSFHNDRKMYLVMDYHPGGDLYALMQRQGPFTEDMMKFYIAEIASAIDALHGMGYIHRDVKPENILIDYVGHIKLTDFGSAVKFNENGYLIRDALSGTADYVAPEIIRGVNKAATDSKDSRLFFGFKVDYWSLGVMAFEMAYCYLPFDGDNFSATCNKICNFKNFLKLPENNSTSKSFQMLLSDLLTDEDVRIDYKGIAVHTFFEHFDWNSLKDKLPPFIPVIKSDDDTSNFEIPTSPSRNKIDTAFLKDKDNLKAFHLPYIGFTYTRLCDDAGDANLNRRLSINVRTVLSYSDVGDADKQRLLEDNKHLKRMSVTANDINKTKSKYIKELEEKVTNIITRRDDEIKLLEKTKEENINLKKMCSMASENLRKESASRSAAERELEKKTILFLKQKEDLHQHFAKEIQKEKEIFQEFRDKILPLNENLAKAAELSEAVIRENDAIKKENERLKALRDSSLEKLSKAHKNYVEEIEEKLQNEKKSNQDLSTKISEKDNQIAVLLSQLDEIKMTTQQVSVDLSKKLGSASEKCNYLERKCKTSGLLVGQVKDLLEADSEEDIINKLRNLISELDSCNQLLMDEKIISDSLRSKIKVYDEKINCTLENLTKRHESLVNKEESQEHLIEELQHKVYTLTSEIEVLQNRNENLVGENEKATQELKCVQKELEEQVSKMKEASEREGTGKSNTTYNLGELDLSGLHQQLEKYKQELDEKVKVSEEYKLRISEVTDELKICKSDLRLAERNKERLETYLDLSREKARNLKGENKEITIKLEELQKETSSLTEKLLNQENLYQSSLVDNNRLMRQLETERSQSSETRNLLLEEERQQKDKDKQIQSLQKENYDLKDELDTLERVRNELGSLLSKERSLVTELRNEIADKCGVISADDEKIATLKAVLSEMDGQCTQLEVITEKNRAEIEASNRKLSELRDQFNEAVRQKNEEKSLKQQAQSRVRQLESQLEDHMHRGETERGVMEEQLSRLRSQLDDCRLELESAQTSLSRAESQIESTRELIESERSELEIVKLECCQLHNEKGKLLSHLTSLKCEMDHMALDIRTLQEEKEDWKARYEEISVQFEENNAEHNLKEFKLESQLKQQKKLIEYLQDSKDNKDSKKKNTLVAMLHNQAENTTPKSARQLQDLEDILERERAKVQRLQVALDQANREIDQISKDRSRENGVIEDKQIAFELAHNSNVRGSTRKVGLETKSRILHNIPHKFVPAFNMMATKCCGCLSTVHFSRNCLRCEACQKVAHVQCADKINQEAPLCGLPSKLIQQYANMRMKTVRFADSSLTSLDPQKEPCSEGFVKIYQPSTQSWERERVKLRGSTLCIYHVSGGVEEVEEIDLVPRDGHIKVVEAIIQSELPRTLDSDLPFVFKLEICTSNFTRKVGTVYMMAPTFPEKQGWVLALRDVIQNSPQHDPHRLQGLPDVVNTLYTSDCGMLNCLISFQDKRLCVGTSGGLKIIETHDRSHHPKVSIQGCGAVYKALEVPQLNCVLLITGQDRSLSMCELKMLEVFSGSSQNANCQLEVVHVENLKNCHLMAVSQHAHEPYLCVAQQSVISLLRWNLKLRMFELVKQKQNTEPCGCILFTEDAVLVGTDSVYEISLSLPHKSIAFIDQDDEDLEVINILLRDKCFPISIIEACSKPNRKEYLLCYQHLGIFVDQQGKRTRPHDVSWGSLPVAIEKSGDFLYLQNYDSIDVIKLDASLGNRDQEPVRAVFETPHLRLLGAGKNGSMFATTAFDKTIQIMHLNGQSFVSF